MHLMKRILQFKPALKRLCAAIVICSPVVALTNANVRKVEEKTKVEKPVKTPASFPADRCLGIQPPRF